MQFPKDITSILIIAGLAVLLIMYLANNYLKDTVKDEIVEYEKNKTKEKIEKIKKIKKNQIQQQMRMQHEQQLQQQMLQQQMLQKMAKQNGNGNMNVDNEMDDLESYVDPLKNDNFDMGNNMGDMENIGMNGGNGGNGGNNSGAHFQDQQNQMLNDRIFNN